MLYLLCLNSCFWRYDSGCGNVTTGRSIPGHTGKNSYCWMKCIVICNKKLWRIRSTFIFQDLRGCTALHIAADKSTDNADESKDLEQMLIKKGANLFLKDNFGRLPLHYLFTKLPQDRYKYPDHFYVRIYFTKLNFCLTFFYYKFSKSGKNEITSQMDPVESYSIFSSAMKNQQLDVIDDFGRSPLHYAACRGATVCCMLLVQVRI